MSRLLATALMKMVIMDGFIVRIRFDIEFSLLYRFAHADGHANGSVDISVDE